MQITNKAKKIRKYTRQAVQMKLGEGMNVMNTIVRQRPKYMPKWAWMILWLPLVKPKYYRVFYKYL